MKLFHAIKDRYTFCSAVLLFACLLIVSPTSAQRYPFFNLNVENGLIQSQPTSLAQDHYGNLWIGTIGGLSRYDGKNFTNYTIRNGLPNNMVQAIAADKKGNIWIATPETISSFNGKVFKKYHLPDGEDNRSKEIKIDAKDTVWFRSGGKVYKIVGDKIVPVPLPSANVFVSAILPTDSSLWIAGTGAVYRYRKAAVDSFLFPLPPGADKPPFVFKIYKDRQQHIWLATNMGLYTIDSGRVTYPVLNGQPLKSLPPVYSITQDANNALWLGTNSGVLHLTNNTLHYYNKKNGLSDNTFYDVLTDAEGDVWLASDGQGLFRFSGTQFTGLDESMGLPSGQIMAITADRNGKLFLGTYDAGLYTFENGQVYPLAFPSNPVPSITAMCMTRDGRLWIGTRGKGLWRYSNIFWQYTYPDHHFPSNIITALYPDTSGKLFIGFVNGAIVHSADSFKRIPVTLTVESFLTVGNDSVLMATDNGIKLYSGGVVTPFKTGTEADSATPQCFALLNDELWIGTSDNGAICYNMKTKRSFVFNKSNGLHSDFIYNIIADNDGNIWIGTGFGIHKIGKGSGSNRQIVFYGREQGITGMESNHNAVVKMRDGSIWFGTTNGAVHYQPHSNVVSSEPISIMLQSVKLFGEDIADTSYFDSTDTWYNVPYNLRLPYQKNNITFTFQAVTLAGGQPPLYRYRIDGLDAPWSDWSATNSVTYSALPPGKYVFRVMCMDPSGDKKIKELSYPFEIITPFQKTKWFRLAVLGACILLGITLQYIANKRKQRREQLLEKLRAEEQAKIRVRTAEDFHDEVGNKLTRINILTNVLRSKVGGTPDADRLLKQIEENATQLYSGTRDILWSLQPANDNLYEILHRIRNFGIELFQDTNVDFVFTGTDERWRQYKLPLDVSRNLVMIFKEALNNCLKYSKATNVQLEVNLRSRGILQMVLTDNGVGFDVRTVKKGHGINNMNIRAARINGKLYIDSRENKGTIINLTFKIPSNR